MHRILTQRRNIWYQRKLFCIFVSECTADMLSLHMDSWLVETSLHGQQSWGVEEHSLMLAGLCQPSNGCNCPHNTWTSGPGGSSQCKIEPEGEYVYILLTFLLRRLNIWRRRLLFATNSNRDRLWDFNSRLNIFPQWGTGLRMEYFCRRQILETMTDACLLKHR